ncbi:unnamed protein product [Phaeothamnion confervicola]
MSCAAASSAFSQIYVAMLNMLRAKALNLHSWSAPRCRTLGCGVKLHRQSCCVDAAACTATERHAKVLLSFPLTFLHPLNPSAPAFFPRRTCLKPLCRSPHSPS